MTEIHEKKLAMLEERATKDREIMKLELQSVKDRINCEKAMMEEKRTIETKILMLKLQNAQEQLHHDRQLRYVPNTQMLIRT